jgi:DNA-binding transcriptional LysR family regulator
MTASTLDVRQMKHIWELERHKSFRRAAESLGISQPALTKSIQNLESNLGVILFDRSRGGVTPTPYCSVILKHAHAVFLEVEEMNHQLARIDQSQGGELKIGAGPVMSASVLLNPIRKLVKQMPEIHIEIMVDDWSNLLRLARQGDLHAVIVDIEHLRGEHDFEKIPLPRLQNILVCRADHPLAASGAVLLQDLFEFPLALPQMTKRLSNWLMRNTPRDMSAKKDSAAVHRIQCQSIPLLRHLVASTNYITGGPRDLFETELSAGDFVELRLEGCDALFTEPTVGHVKGRTLPRAAHAFLEIIGGKQHQARPTMRRGRFTEGLGAMNNIPRNSAGRAAPSAKLTNA